MTSRIRFRVGCFVRMVLLQVLFAMTVQRAPAQCEFRWLPGDGVPGVGTGGINAMTLWDPDGPGPRGPVVVLAGNFMTVGDVAAAGIGTYDPATGEWGALGTGTNGDVMCLAALPGGNLIAGGYFTVAGGVTVNGVARWDGAAWSALGPGLTEGNSDSSIKALAVLHNGDIVAGGFFPGPGGTHADYIARWNGTEWLPLGSGMSDEVTALAVLPTGDLVASGEFSSAGGVPVPYLARWDGSAWSGLGNGGWGAASFLVLPNGDLIAGSGGVVARWNGSAWSMVGTPLYGVHWALAVLPNGDLVTCSDYDGNIRAAPVFSWNGMAWTRMGAGMNGSTIRALLTLPDGSLLAGGSFISADGVPLKNLARWDGAHWSALWTGMNSTVYALAELPNGDLVAGGEFTRAGSVPARSIARWDGAAWSPIGTGMALAGYNGCSVNALAVLPNGDLVAGGSFTHAGGVVANNVARWNGSAWLPLGSGIQPANPAGGLVFSLAALPNGDIVVGGVFTSAGGVPVHSIARWNGSAWSSLGPGLLGCSERVSALAVLPNGDLVAGGMFLGSGTTYLGYIARWDGSTWLPIGGGMNPGSPFCAAVNALAVQPDGGLIAGGTFSYAGTVAASCVARWDGAVWSPLGSGMNNCTSLAALPNGEVIAGGSFTVAGGIPASRIARWDGAAWSSLGSGMNATVAALASLRNGDLAAGGGFTTAGDQVSAFFARCTSRPACPVDADCNGAVEPADVAWFVRVWHAGATTGTPGGDFDGNGHTDPADVAAFVNAWLVALSAGC